MQRSIVSYDGSFVQCPKLKMIPKNLERWWNLDPFLFLNTDERGIYRESGRRLPIIASEGKYDILKVADSFVDQSLVVPLFRTLFDYRGAGSYKMFHWHALVILSTICRKHPEWIDRNQLKYFILLTNSYGEKMRYDVQRIQIGIELFDANILNIMTHLFPLHVDFFLSTIDKIQSDPKTVLERIRHSHFEFLGQSLYYYKHLVPRRRIIKLVKSWIKKNRFVAPHIVGHISIKLVVKLTLVECIPDIRLFYEANPGIERDVNIKTSQGWGNFNFWYFDEILKKMNLPMKVGDACVRTCSHCDDKNVLLVCTELLNEKYRTSIEEGEKFVKEWIEKDYFQSLEDEEGLENELSLVNNYIYANSIHRITCYGSDGYRRTTGDGIWWCWMWEKYLPLLNLIKSWILVKLGKPLGGYLSFSLMTGDYNTSQGDTAREKSEAHLLLKTLEPRFKELQEIFMKFSNVNSEIGTLSSCGMKVIHKTNPKKLFVSRSVPHIGIENNKENKVLMGLFDWGKYNSSYLIPFTSRRKRQKSRDCNFVSLSYISDKFKSSVGMKVIVVDIFKIKDIQTLSFTEKIRTQMVKIFDQKVKGNLFCLVTNHMDEKSRIPLLAYVKKVAREICFVNLSDKKIVDSVSLHDHEIISFSVCDRIVVSCSEHEVYVTDLSEKEPERRSFRVSGLEGFKCKKVLQESAKKFFVIFTVYDRDVMKEINIEDFQSRRFSEKVFFLGGGEQMKPNFEWCVFNKHFFIRFGKESTARKSMVQEPTKKRRKRVYYSIFSRKTTRKISTVFLEDNFTDKHRYVEQEVALCQNILFITGYRIIRAYHLFSGHKLCTWNLRCAVMNLQVSYNRDKKMIELFFLGGDYLRKIDLKYVEFCGSCKCPLKNSKVCSGCYRVKFCSVVCQKANWKSHKKICVL